MRDEPDGVCVFGRRLVNVGVSIVPTCVVPRASQLAQRSRSVVP
jgi:hypothetical protein